MVSSGSCPSCGAPCPADGPCPSCGAPSHADGAAGPFGGEGVTREEARSIRHLLDNDPAFHAGLAELELGLANLRIQLDQPGDPLAGVEQDSRMFRERGDRRSEGMLLREAAALRLSAGDAREAVRCLRRAAEAFDSAGVPEETVETLRHASDISRVFLQDYATALGADEMALVIARSLGDRSLEAHCRWRLANTYFCRGDHGNALEQVRLGLDVATRFGNVEAVLNLALFKGRVHASLHDLDEARSCFDLALELCDIDEHPAVGANALMSAAGAFNEHGHALVALEYLERVAGLAHKHDLPGPEYDAMMAAAEALGSLARHAEAETATERAVALCMAHGNVPGLFNALVSRALAIIGRRDWLRAEDACREAADVLDGVEDVADVERPARALAGAMARLGLFDAALSLFGRILAARSRLQDTESDMALLAEMGAAYRDMGALSRAEECSRRMLAAITPDTTPRVRLLAYITMGKVAREQGRLNDAMGWFQSALELAGEYDAPADANIALLNMGRVCLLSGRRKDARQHFTRAEDIGPEPDRPPSPNYFMWMGDLFFSDGDRSSARDHYQKAITEYERVGYVVRAARARDALARLEAGESGPAPGPPPLPRQGHEPPPPPLPPLPPENA